MQKEAERLEDIHRSYVLLLDIDGVLTENQQPISDKVRSILGCIQMPVYFVTGNNFTKSIDILGWHSFSGIFCNNGDELRDRYGYLEWVDNFTKPLPKLNLENHTNNCIEWRSPRMVNYSKIGRYATPEERLDHDASWRDEFIAGILAAHKDIEAVKGGSVSVDIYSKGADKSRAAKYINGCNRKFIFIGDKTNPGGNDYPIVEYCSTHKENIALTTTGVHNTIELIEKIKKGELWL